MGCGNLALQIPFWMTYPEIAPVYPGRTKSSLVSANRAGCVLPKKGEWQLSNIWQLGTLRMVAMGKIRKLWKRNIHIMIRQARGR